MAWSATVILTVLAEGPKLTRQLMVRLGKDRESMRRCLVFLRQKGFVASAEGVHQITDEGRQFLSDGGVITSGPCGGKAASRRGPNLRQRAWNAMGMRDGFGLDDLLTMLCDGSERSAAANLTRYLAALEAAGYLLALPRRGENGEKRWRLRRERLTGPEAPAMNTRTRRVTDCNTGEVFHL